MTNNRKEINLNENHRIWWNTIDSKWKVIFENPAVGSLQSEKIEDWKLKRVINNSIVDCSNEGIFNLNPLSELLNLERLICSENNISSLEPIKNLENLIWLNCEKTNISKKEIKDFKKTNPNCIVKTKTPKFEFKLSTWIGVIAVVFLIAWHFFDLGNSFLIISIAVIAIIIGLLSK